MELRRTKSLATIIAFPIMKNDGTLISGAAGLDSEIDGWSDGSLPGGFADCANEAAEIGATGQYYLALTADEMNADYVIVQIKSSTTGAVTQTLLINTTLQRAEVITNGDKTGYELATTPPAAAEIRAEMDANSTKLANLDAPISSIVPGTPMNVTVEHTNIMTGD
jgi:hypothetical protein